MTYTFILFKFNYMKNKFEINKIYYNFYDKLNIKLYL